MLKICLAAALVALASNAHAQFIAGPGPSSNNANGTVVNLGGLPFLIQGTAGSSTSPIQQSTSVGWGACSAMNFSSLQFNVCFGTNAGQSISNGAEETFLGILAGQFVTSGAFNTAVGEHALGYATTENQDTAVGNDTIRDFIGAGAETAIGAQACRNGGGSKNSCVGVSSMYGDSANIVFGGTGTINDTIVVTATGSFPGSPVSSTYTVASTGMTPAQLAAAVAAKVSADFVSTAIPGGSGSMALNSSTPTSLANIVALNWAGTETTGNNVVVTVGITGAATETAVVNNGFTGANNIAFGYQAMLGYGLTSASFNVAGGQNAGESLSSGSNNLIFGNGAAVNLTVGGSDVILSPNGFLADIIGNYNTVAGYGAATLVTSTRNTILGAQVATVTLVGGGNNILVGKDNAVDTPTANTSNFLNVGNVIAGGMAAITATQLSTCGTTPTIVLAQSSDSRGTFATGTGATQCTLTFLTARTAAPTCVVSSRSGVGPAYSTTTATLALSTAAASTTYDYICMGL